MSTLPTIGVCGLGQMGSSAAVLFARYGHRVILWGRDEAKLLACRPQLERMSQFLDEHAGRISQASDDEVDLRACESTSSGAKQLNIELTTDLDTINSQCDYVLECIAENLEQKCEFLSRLRSGADRGAVLMSCTSGLSITTMGQRSGVGARLTGAHFWNPPHLMPLVEVISGSETDVGLGDQVAELLRQVGKIAIVCKDVPGFIGNRLLHALFREAVHLVESGICSASDVDLVARLTFGLRLPAVGPCENMDLVGFPLMADIQQYLLDDLSSAKTTMPLIAEHLAAGKQGMRSGQGFYDWTKRDSAELIAARDRQILLQLKTLRELGRLD
jgi:3-hydroxybutyryl-CoA dehydrogenase